MSFLTFEIINAGKHHEKPSLLPDVTKTESIIVLLYTDSKKITISRQYFFKAGDKGT